MDFISPWIHTTERCNLKCHYCYVKGNAVMAPDIYDKLGVLLLNAPTDKRHLRFAGGEPLLVFDIWEPFARRMLEHKGTTVEVLTNLRAVPDSFWEFAELDSVNISISVDNGETVKVLDKSMDEKLKRIRDPWILTTVTKENIENLDVLAAFIGMNNYGWAITTDYFGTTTPHWEVLAEALLGVVSVLKGFGYNFTKISFNNFSVNPNFSGCRAGNEMFAVAPNGSIYKCQTEIGKPCEIGNVHNGYTPKDMCTRKECDGCSVSDFCHGWCSLYYKTPNPMCNVIKLFANDVLKEARKNAK